MSVWTLSAKIYIHEIVFRFCNKVHLLLREIIFNIFLKKFLSSFCFLIELKKMFKTSSFCLHATLRCWRHWATALSIIHWSVATHTSDFIPPTLWPSNQDQIWIWSVIKCDARASLRDTNPWCKRSQATFVGWLCGRLLIRGLSILS